MIAARISREKVRLWRSAGHRGEPRASTGGTARSRRAEILPYEGRSIALVDLGRAASEALRVSWPTARPFHSGGVVESAWMVPTGIVAAAPFVAASGALIVERERPIGHHTALSGPRARLPFPRLLAPPPSNLRDERLFRGRTMQCG